MNRTFLKWFFRRRYCYGPKSARNYSTRKKTLKTNLSYFSSPSREPLHGVTIGNVVDQSSDEFGDREAVIVCHQNVRKSFSQFKTEIDALACGFIALGLKKGDRIGIWSPNNYQWLLTQFASSKAGLILVNVNPAYQAKELAYCVRSSGMKGIVIADKFKTQNYYELLAQVIPSLPQGRENRFKNGRNSNLEVVISLSEEKKKGVYNFEEILNSGGPEEKKTLAELQQKVQFDEPINIQYTSGTTGNPKGATLTHHNVINNAYALSERLGYFETAHRVCISVPLYHCFGCILGTLACLLSGNCSIFPFYNFNAVAVAEAIHKEKATVVYGTPTMLIDLLHLPNFGEFDFDSLQLALTAGAPCPEELVKQFTEKMRLKHFVSAYGTTELSPLITTNFLNDSLEKKTTTVGPLLPHGEMKIVNQNNEIVPIGESGEIWARGYFLMLGYWNDPEKTNECITPDRWYKTGDLGTVDEDGYLKIVGRIKDMIIRGGENIYPREIEEVLHTHEKIAETQIVGVPDARMGEEVCAWVKTKSGETLTKEDVKAFCKGKLAHFKIPRYVLFVEEFPKTVTGKIQKFVMREKSIEILKL